MKILEFAFVGYPVTDVPRSRAFYENVLGLTPGTVWDDGPKAWVEYEVGPHTLAITNMDLDAWRPSDQGAGVALEVDNYEEAIEELQKAGVTFVMPTMDSPVCRMALIADPDGNRICIHKRK